MQGQKLCPICTRYIPQADNVCRHCGYDFSTGEEGDASAPSVIPSETPEEGDTGGPDSPLPEVPTPTPIRSGLRTLVALIVIVGLAAPLLLSLPIRDAIEAIEGFGAAERPRGSGGSEEPDRAAARSCIDSLNRYLEPLLANDGRGAGSVQSLLLDAANDLGVTSFEYETLIRLYAEEGLLELAAGEGSEKALRRSRKLVRKECRQRYR